VTTEIYMDERDGEPGGIYYDGPCYTPEEDDGDYDDCDVEVHDTYEAEHDYGGYDDDNRDAYEAPAPRRQTYPSPVRQKLTTLKMPRPVRARRDINNEF
jgi:hypothetical protein